MNRFYLTTAIRRQTIFRLLRSLSEILQLNKPATRLASPLRVFDVVVFLSLN